ncbi:MAG: hypothetical protein R3A47_05405 [Polyangiales bacterium]
MILTVTVSKDFQDEDDDNDGIPTAKEIADAMSINDPNIDRNDIDGDGGYRTGSIQIVTAMGD